MPRRRSCLLAITFRQSLLSLSILVCGTTHVAAQNLPLLEKAKVLQCVESESAAKVALGAFWDIQDNVGDFPDQHFLKGETNTLHAATLDILLNSLVTTATRFPALRSQVERTMLQWNYCDVMQDGVLFDIESDGVRVNRSLAAKTSPIDWQGFKSVGFFGELDGRFVPELLSSDQQSLRVDFEWLFHRIYRQQCFPHPDTSYLFDRFENKINQKLAPLPETDGEAIYPYEWHSECITPVAVPSLEANVVVAEPMQDVPLLQTQISIVEAMLNVPKLKTTVLITQAEMKIPLLNTKVEVKAATVTIPKLLTRVVVDKPKLVVKPRVVNKGSTYGGGQAHTHSHTERSGFSGGGLAHSHTTQVKTTPVVHAVKVVEPKKAIVVDKNQQLLERLLSGFSSGNNVFIVDKIQLTVNEYNGSVETVISSSDVGSTNAVLPANVPVSEVKQFVKSQFVPSAKPVVSLPTETPVKVVKKPALKALPKVVVIKKKVGDLLDVPRLQTQLKLTAKQVTKPHKRRKSKRASQQKRSNDGSSSLFIYKPYENGDKPKAGEKTVEQLLQEYAEYEASREAAKASKKKQLKTDKVESNKLVPKAADRTIDKQASATVQSTFINSDKNKAPKVSQEVEISRLQTQVVISKKLTDKTKHTKPKNIKQADINVEKVLATSSDFKNTRSKNRYTFSNKKPDSRDTAQFNVGTINVPAGLGIDSPVPYFIDEDFSDKAPTKGSQEGQKKKKKGLGLAGNVYLKQSLDQGTWAIGGAINRKLIKDDYWFARGGWNYSLENEEDPFSYSWGIGYSDWHPGTFSAQLNNWGPLKPGDGLALDKAVASFGYSVKSEILKKHRLSFSGALNIPIDGNSSAAANFRWSPKENWYINSSISYPLEGDGDPKWSYGFGYSDWRPDKFNLQYSNYGANDLFEPNYKKNGTWSFSYNWKF